MVIEYHINNNLQRAGQMQQKRYRFDLILMGITMLVSAVFLLAPQLDIIVSGWFFYRSGFWLADETWAAVFRWVYMFDVIVFILIMLVLALLALAVGPSRTVPLRLSIYPLMVFLLAPLLLVNSLLKANWGRARPADIVEFGGDLSFTPALWVSDQCQENCSFTSGEGAAIATTAILLAVLFWPGLKTRGRGWMIAGLSVWFVLGAGLRVATGRHFISDTLLSLLFCALIARLVYVLLKIQQDGHKFTLKNIQHDWRLLLSRLSKTD